MVRQNVLTFLRNVRFLREISDFEQTHKADILFHSCVLWYGYLQEPYQRIRRWHWCRFTSGECQCTLWLRGWLCFIACLDDLEERKICWPYRELNFTSSTTRSVVLFWYTIHCLALKFKTKNKNWNWEWEWIISAFHLKLALLNPWSFYQRKKYEFPMKQFFIYYSYDHTRSMRVFVLCHITYWPAYKIIRAITVQRSALARK